MKDAELEEIFQFLSPLNKDSPTAKLIIEQYTPSETEEPIFPRDFKNLIQFPSIWKKVKVTPRCLDHIVIEIKRLKTAAKANPMNMVFNDIMSVSTVDTVPLSEIFQMIDPQVLVKAEERGNFTRFDFVPDTSYSMLRDLAPISEEVTENAIQNITNLSSLLVFLKLEGITISERALYATKDSSKFLLLLSHFQKTVVVEKCHKDLQYLAIRKNSGISEKHECTICQEELDDILWFRCPNPAENIQFYCATCTARTSYKCSTCSRLLNLI